jgi:hypothetical protein
MAESPILATAKGARIDEVMGLPDQMSQVTQTLVMHILGIDDKLIEIDRYLDDVQPPHTGKIRIQFWRRNDRVRPLPVAWKRTRGGKWRAELLPTKNLIRRAKTSREFAPNRHIVKELLAVASDLLRKRAEAYKKIENYTRAVNLTTSENVKSIATYQSRISAIGVLVPAARQAIGKE